MGASEFSPKVGDYVGYYDNTMCRDDIAVVTEVGVTHIIAGIKKNGVKIGTMFRTPDFGWDKTWGVWPTFQRGDRLRIRRLHKEHGPFFENATFEAFRQDTSLFHKGRVVVIYRADDGVLDECGAHEAFREDEG